MDGVQYPTNLETHRVFSGENRQYYKSYKTAHHSILLKRYKSKNYESITKGEVCWGSGSLDKSGIEYKQCMDSVLVPPTKNSFYKNFILFKNGQFTLTSLVNENITDFISFVRSRLL